MKNPHSESKDLVDHPAHYNQGRMEVIDAIEGLELPFIEGSILKYIARWRFRDGSRDLRKAKWYLDRLIQEEARGEALRCRTAPLAHQGPKGGHGLDRGPVRTNAGRKRSPSVLVGKRKVKTKA